MAKTSQLTIFCAVIAVLSVTAAMGAKQQNQLPQAQTAQPAPFTLTITAVRPEISTGEEARIQIVVTDTSSLPIDLPLIMLHQPEAHYTIDVRDEKRQPAPPTAYSRYLSSAPNAPGSAGVAAAEPGQPYKEEDLILTKLYDITIPGKYSVQLTAHWRKLPEVKSNVITITVLT
jgi:hypothetical protein